MDACKSRDDAWQAGSIELSFCWGCNLAIAQQSHLLLSRYGFSLVSNLSLKNCWSVYVIIDCLVSCLSLLMSLLLLMMPLWLSLLVLIVAAIAI